MNLKSRNYESKGNPDVDAVLPIFAAMERKTLFADLIIPLGVPRLFTYRVPMLLNDHIRPLQRVIVPFGTRKRYTAIVHALHEKAPEGYQARYIEALLEDEPGISPQQMQLWEWMAEYYMCSLGEIMQAALPAGLKLSSETTLRIYGEFDRNEISGLSDREYLILEALEKAGQLNLLDVENIAGIKTVYPIIREMIEKRLIVAVEELKESYKPKTEVYIRLSSEYKGDDALNALLDSLKRAPRQQEVILAYLSSINLASNEFPEIKRSVLLKRSKAYSAPLQILCKKGVFILDERVVSRLGGEEMIAPEIALSAAQTHALNSIQEHFAEGQVVLLHGLTGSGKTEIYIRLIQEQLDAGKQVLYLLPEIALTAQIINRLRAHFGRKVQVYHSRYSENERVEVWNAVSRSDASEGAVILGARSSVFLPYHNLGLVIVDEEHEINYKQSEPAPRYHARDTAIVLAGLCGANTLLGSATPSIESYHNALEGKYRLVKLEERFGGAHLPEVIINDLKEDAIKRRMRGIFSPSLVKSMEEVLLGQGQIILFQNRRGFAPLLQCNNCQWVPSCAQCDISLTYHKAIHQLRCHYCSYTLNVPSHCAQCNSTDIRMKGFGTEKIEEELETVLPGVSSSRMDLDTTRSRYAYNKIIEDFEQERVQVLIGTQMVTKGLDFDNVKLVGVLSADAMLNFPDFRAHERSFQLLSQVAGRAGRKEDAGRVIIQTWKPDHHVLDFVRQHDYEGFYFSEIAERQRFAYPPFSRIIHLTLKHENQTQLDEAGDMLARFLRNSFGERVLGPEYPPVARIRNLYQKRILLKIELKASQKKVKQVLREQCNSFFKEFPLKGFRLIVDVDPVY